MHGHGDRDTGHYQVERARATNRHVGPSVRVGHRVLACGAAGCAAASMLGCVTPFVFNADTAAVGLFSFDRDRPAEGVVETRLRGIGIGVDRGSMFLGYRESYRMVAKLDGTDYAVRTSQADLYVGEIAETQGVAAIIGESVSSPHSGDRAQ